jgi:hypothetical protein
MDIFLCKPMASVSVAVTHIHKAAEDNNPQIFGICCAGRDLITCIITESHWVTASHRLPRLEREKDVIYSYSLSLLRVYGGSYIGTSINWNLSYPVAIRLIFLNRARELPHTLRTRKWIVVVPQLFVGFNLQKPFYRGNFIAILFRKIKRLF